MPTDIHPPALEERAQQQKNIRDLALLAYHEARGEPADGMAAVMHVAMNRLARPERFGHTLQEVISQPNQFSSYNGPQWAAFDPSTLPDADKRAYNRAFQLAAGVVRGTLPDPTGGADHFLNRELTKKQTGRIPSWVGKMEPRGKRGQHNFYKEKP